MAEAAKPKDALIQAVRFIQEYKWIVDVLGSTGHSETWHYQKAVKSLAQWRALAKYLYRVHKGQDATKEAEILRRDYAPEGNPK